MKFRRLYSAPGDPYAGLVFEPRTSRIVNPDGSVIFEAKDVMVPDGWSQVAVDVLAQKYCRKAGVPTATVRVPEDDVPEWLWRSEAGLAIAQRSAPERDSRQVFNRLAGCWTYWGWKYGYFDTEDDARVYFDEMCAMLARQIGAPNSPQWFNTGLHWAYGISGPAQGHYFVDPRTDEVHASRRTRSNTRKFRHASSFPSKTISSTKAASSTASCAKRASSRAAPAPAPTSRRSARTARNSPAAARRAGLMSFLKVFDRAAGAIKSGGTTRRAAKMVVLNADHPDIEEFVNWKVREERKVADLVIGSRMLREAHQCDHGGRARHAHSGTRAPRSRAQSASCARPCARRSHAGMPSGCDAAGARLRAPGLHVARGRAVRHRLGFGSLRHRFGPELEQLGSRSERVLRRARSRRQLGSDFAHQRQHRQDDQGARSVGADRACRVAVRRSGPAVRRHDSRVAHVRERRSHQRDESVQRIRLHRRHGVQSRVVESGEVRERERRFRREALRGSVAHLDDDARDLRHDGPDAVEDDRREESRLSHARPRLRESRHAAHAHGPSLRFGRRLRLVRRNQRADDRHRVSHVGRDGATTRLVRALRGEPRVDAARHSQSSPRRIRCAGCGVRRPDASHR